VISYIELCFCGIWLRPKVLTDEVASVAHEAKLSPENRESARSEAESREAGELRVRIAERISLVFMVFSFTLS